MPEIKYNEDRKVTLEELVDFGDETKIDLTATRRDGEGTYALIKEEIDDFVSKPIQKNRKKNSLFDTKVNSQLKKAIDDILKTRNIKEEVLKKKAQYEFDVKMARIRKIKSKTYRKMKRKDKLKKEELIESFTECSEVSEEEASPQEFRPTFTFENTKEESEDASEDNSECSIVENAFQVPGFTGNEMDFLKEKKQIVEEEAPAIVEHYLPGWGDWAGDGIEFKKTRSNTVIEKKDGIENKERQDYKKNHLIINENTETNERYTSKIPYGYSYKDYKKKLKTPISLETTSLRIFNRFVKKDDTIQGKKISPKEFDPQY